MDYQPPSPSLHLPRSGIALFLLLCFTLSLYNMAVFIPSSRYALDNFWDDKPKAPISYRVLVPLVAEGITEAIPSALADAARLRLLAFRDGEPGKRLLRYEQEDTEPRALVMLDHVHILHTFIKLGVVYASMLAFIAMLYALARALFPREPICAFIAPVLALLVIPFFSGDFAMSYDFAEMFFVCALLLLLLRERWGAYLACLALATLNKETTIFIIFFSGVYFFYRLPRRRYLTLMVVQLIVFAVVQGGITFYFAHIYGLHPRSLTHELSVWPMRQWLYAHDHALPMMSGLLAAMLLALPFWQQKPVFLRTALWIAPPNILAFVLFCNASEYRVLYSSLPVLMLLGSHTLVKLAAVHRA